jgi:hypothetical protein
MYSARTHLLARNRMSTLLDWEMVVVALKTFGGSLFASAGLIVSSALRTVSAASAESTFTRRASVARKICSWARSAKSWIAWVTGGVLMAAESASVTIGRAADTKFDVRASRSVA